MLERKLIYNMIENNSILRSKPIPIPRNRHNEEYQRTGQSIKRSMSIGGLRYVGQTAPVGTKNGLLGKCHAAVSATSREGSWHPLADDLYKYSQLTAGGIIEQKASSGDYEYLESVSSVSTNDSSSLSMSPLSSFSSLCVTPYKSPSNSHILAVNAVGDKSSGHVRGTRRTSSSTAEILARALTKDEQKKLISASKRLFVSNLTHSFKAVCQSVDRSTQLIASYSTRPVPRMIKDSPENNPSHNADIDVALGLRGKSYQELLTYSHYTGDLVEDFYFEKPPTKVSRFRDQRVNAAFLRMYALDFLARISGLLPNVHSQEELLNMIGKRPWLARFHEKYDLFRISEVSQEKLWQNIILHPREEELPAALVDGSNYIYVGDDGDSYDKRSLIRRESSIVPWIHTGAANDISYKPAGILNNCRERPNGLSPNSGSSKPQYTIKGWCNPRWLDLSLD